MLLGLIITRNTFNFCLLFRTGHDEKLLWNYKFAKVFNIFVPQVLRFYKMPFYLQSMKAYAIVDTYDDGSKTEISTAVVPTKWIMRGEKFVFCPSNPKEEIKAARNNEDVDVSQWKLFDIAKVKGRYGKFLLFIKNHFQIMLVFFRKA